MFEIERRRREMIRYKRPERKPKEVKTDEKESKCKCEVCALS
jgi:hypothetical protein